MMKTIVSVVGLVIILGIVSVVISKNGLNTSTDEQEVTGVTSGTLRNTNTEDGEVSGSGGIPDEIIRGTERQEAFSRDNLRTNTSIRSIPLNEIFGGGPEKDGIPAILNPDFISVSEAKGVEQGDRQGVAVISTSGNTAKFYPYSILVWHEIVNDEIEGQPIIVTFCPLCGSSIVFDPHVNGEVRTFGVSGKLWESNLLMYDHKNENLWSQIIGEAVVGDETGTVLEVFPSQLITFSEFVMKYPNGQVLSRNTGHSRNYNFYPYGDYDTSNTLIFPVSIEDKRLPAKELMFIVNVGEYSGAFKRSDVFEIGVATLEIGDTIVTVRADGDEIKATDQNGNVIAGYIAMWFSWAAHHQNDGFVWVK